MIKKQENKAEPTDGLKTTRGLKHMTTDLADTAVKASIEYKIRKKRETTKKLPTEQMTTFASNVVKLDTKDISAPHKLRNAQNAQRVVTTPKHTQTNTSHQEQNGQEQKGSQRRQEMMKPQEDHNQ
jgi:hypothetical protein